MSVPLGPRNPAVQHLRRLSRRRRARLEAGAFVIDGPTLVAEALDADLELLDVFIDVAHPLDATLRARLDERGVPVHELADGVLTSAVDPVTPNGVAAIGRRPATGLDQVTATGTGLVLVLVGIADPGNAGTLVRSAAAAGAAAVVVCGDAVDPFGPKTVRSSAGATFRVPLVEVADPTVVLDQLGAAGYTRLAAVARDGVEPEALDLLAPTALVLGNEAHGLPASVDPHLDGVVTIPMTAATESLNVAMAGTVLLFEMARQRRRNG